MLVHLCSFLAFAGFYTAEGPSSPFWGSARTAMSLVEQFTARTGEQALHMDQAQYHGDLNNVAGALGRHGHDQLFRKQS